MATTRGPLRFIILAAVGQDVNRCVACGCCYVNQALEIRCDLAVSEVMAAAQHDEEAALTNRTIRTLSEVGPGDVRCANGVDVLAIARALYQEACLRGVAAREADQGSKRKA